MRCAPHAGVVDVRRDRYRSGGDDAQCLDQARPRTAALAVDPPATNAQLARDAGLDYPILADPDLHVVDAYGLRHRAGHDGADIAHSASVLVDRSGIVRWTFVTPNFRIRPTPADVLVALDRLPPVGPRP